MDDFMPGRASASRTQDYQEYTGNAAILANNIEFVKLQKMFLAVVDLSFAQF